MQTATIENLRGILTSFAGGQLDLSENVREPRRYRAEIRMPRIVGGWLDINFKWTAQLIENGSASWWRKVDREPRFELEIRRISHQEIQDGLLVIASDTMEQVLFFLPPGHKNILPDIFVEGLHPPGYVGDFPEKLKKLSPGEFSDLTENWRMIPENLRLLVRNEYRRRGLPLPA